ncbi:ParB family chromosome partitioning protein [Variovorax sp. SG517]|uniref:ParB/RepB/Spo0J family partition protein n=1 Tax=Variovorax sp. SG517 TaxID=2587117 RepID=UPI00159DE41B|nr:ParB/RepB/Spo0J family partition protein [Variovorax sp. SG517]NVM90354.1 ParB family chromosome partitioning protein [Variovorax sp. SG517]
MASTRKRLEALTAGLSIPEPMPAAAPESAAAPAPSIAPVLPGAAATAVETRFPPAQAGALAPRTGPGQMLAFRGQMQVVEGELATLRERLRQYDGSTPTRKLDPASIRVSRWANRHPASFENAEFAGLKADIEQAGGNVQPILVRPLPDQAGQYELVFGHRRHRACLELGIPVLAAVWLDELGDAELFAAMDRENRERADLSPYEQGVMYQRALEEQLFPTQRQLAEKLGVSHTWVRKALMVAQLPSAVLECFRSPLEVQHRHAEQLNAALDKDRRGILKRAEKIRGQKLAPAAVVARLLGVEAVAKPEKLAITCDGQTVGSCLRAPDGTVTLTLLPGPVAGLPSEALLKSLAETLQRVKLLG